MSGYVRQSAGTIITGNTILASDFNNEYNAILGAFDASSGHKHDGSVGEGAKITAPALTGLTSVTTGVVVQTNATTFAARTLTGTANRVTISNGDGVSANPTFDISAAYVGQTSITTVGTITAGTWSGLFGAVTGANLTNLTAANISAGTAAINISGNAATATSASTASAVAAANITGTTLASNVVSSSLTAVGTITTGVWQGTVVAGQYGGTGINNSGKTITLGGSLVTIGGFTTTLTASATTTLTLPTTGTLATLAGTEVFVNKTLTAPIISTISNTGTITLPTATTTLVGRDTTDTLSNKTLDTATIAVTQSALDNSTKVATTAYVDTAVATGGVAAASQTEMEAASLTTKYVSPGRQQYHPGMSKAWVFFDGSTGTPTVSYNISGIVKNGTGDYTISFSTAFSSANYCAVTAVTPSGNFATAVCRPATQNSAGSIASATPTGSSMRVTTGDGAGTFRDHTNVYIAFYGDQ